MNFPSPKHYLIIGASRGIGLEFTRQLLLASPTNIVIATHRSTETPLTLQELDKRFHSPPRLWTVKCDVGDESTIESLCLAVSVLLERGGREKCIETVIVNAGVLEWPGGVAWGFRSFEDGFAAYAASKAALNMGLRHLAAELHRKRGVEAPVILALHPGEVNTEMAKGVNLPWEIKGVIEVDESVRGCLKVIGEKGKGGVDEGGRATTWASGNLEEDGAATFWTWDGRRYPW
ncbi:hypothetical protein EYC80_003145 [Monilinia laxa]|uniref:NAD(P)-binding protein n=1 Tax=Monilinia laxa TaxID=61186 RepID=A0A5N6KCT9_MONLA|nr:hypothetical protein EYC80_003145 [Monilinia laxa]